MRTLFSAALIALGLANSANSAVVYEWSGLCTDGCTGFASAVLTLEDTYTPGTALSLADFSSFFYSSSSGAFDVPGDAAFVSLTGTLPMESGNLSDLVVDFAGGGTIFSSFSTGSWTSLFASVGVGEGGTNGEWTLRPAVVPLPAGLPLLLAGLGGLAFLARHQRKSI
ncbi:MAG: VPLPA-CTERM sorting domain-containing protein [Pseudomonadota bacterium]